MDLQIPRVAAVKKGSHIHFKATNIYGSLILDEIKRHLKLKNFGFGGTIYFSSNPKMFGSKGIPLEFREKFNLPIYKLIQPMIYGINKDNLAKNPLLALHTSAIGEIFNIYGVHLNMDPSLFNYILKESRRQKLENIAYPSAPVNTDLPLFDRCTIGTNLLCKKSFKSPDSNYSTFQIGERYLVVDTGETTESVIISTNPIVAGQTVQLTGNGAKHEWTAFDPPMEEWFQDDSPITGSLETVKYLYPERVSQMENKLQKLNLTLYDQVKEDSVLQALKRGVYNCYLPRMGKSSAAITTAELVGSEKVAILTTKNIRIFWEKEFKRLDISNYVVVKSLDDLEKPGKYYLITYNWLRSQVDHTKSERKNYSNYLKAPYRKAMQTISVITKQGNISKVKQETTISQYNLCPHCKQNMVRPVHKRSEQNDKYTEWVFDKGYMCKNINCTYRTNNSRTKGAAWHSKKIIVHKPGTYIDTDLALHSRCEKGIIKGRICQSCKVTDGVWKPPTYKRLMKKFTMIVADELHNAKSINTQIAPAVYNLRAKRRIGLSGTPMSNSAMDIYYPMSWLFRGASTMFPYSGEQGAKQFEDEYCQHVYLEKPTGEKDKDGNEITKVVRKRIPFLANPNEFWSFISSKVIRRNYSDPLYQQALVNAGQKLPSLEIKKVLCEMHPEQKALMLSALKDFKDQFEGIVKEANESNKEVNQTIVIAQMSSLKTIATSPEKINTKLNKQVYLGPDGGGKIANIMHLVQTKMDKGEKVVILSDLVDMQIACEKACAEFNPIRFQTGWTEEEREEAFVEFASDSSKKIFIAGTRAIREGVDLSTANSVICCDLLWSPAFQTQAWSRTLAPTSEDRICEVFLMISKNSLDEHMFNVFYSKMSAAEQAFDKKVLSRRATHVDIRFFVQRVLEDEASLSLQVRDYDDEAIYLPSMNFESFGERY